MFRCHKSLKKDAEISTHRLTHHHMYIHISVIKCTHIHTACNRNPSKCYAEFAKLHPFPQRCHIFQPHQFLSNNSTQRPHRDYQPDTPGTSLTLCVLLSSLQGERKDKVLYNDSDVQSVRNT